MCVRQGKEGRGGRTTYERNRSERCLKLDNDSSSSGLLEAPGGRWDRHSRGTGAGGCFATLSRVLPIYAPLLQEVGHKPKFEARPGDHYELFKRGVCPRDVCCVLPRACVVACAAIDCHCVSVCVYAFFCRVYWSSY